MIGQTISHYRIVEKLGGGGMGVVYKAEDFGPIFQFDARTGEWQMPVMVKIEYPDGVAVLEDAVRAEEKPGLLFVDHRNGVVAARFTLSKFESADKTDTF